MPFTQDIFSGRRNYGDGATRIGQEDRIWYDKVTHTLRIGDGVTPGGLIILGGGGGSGIILVKDENLILTAAASSLNFIGAGVTATVGNPLTGDVDVTIPGGIAGIAVSDEGSIVAATANSMNFVGAGVTGVLVSPGVVHIRVPGIEIRDENSVLTSMPNMINFVGAGVTASLSSNDVTVTIPAAAAASNTIVAKDEGTTLSTAVSTLDFVGPGVIATVPTPGNVEVKVRGIEIRDENVVLTSHPNMINFVGAGVTTTVSMANDVTVTIPAAAAASNTIIVKDEGLSLSLPVTAINFIGDTVSAVYNAGVADVTITGIAQQLGTWIPALKTNTGFGSFTYAKQEGRYVKTGKHVTCYFTIQVSAHTIAIPSSIQLIDLPFTAFDTTAGLGVSEHIGNLVLDYFEFGLTPTHVSGKVLGGTTKVDLYWHGLASGPSAYIALLNETNLTFPDQDYVMIGTITYIAADPTPPPDEEPPR